jgi:hypothetical protein
LPARDRVFMKLNFSRKVFIKFSSPNLGQISTWKHKPLGNLHIRVNWTITLNLKFQQSH